jgi:hypothetical protein
MNAWLAAALQARIRWGGRPDWWHYAITAQFSLAGNRAPLARAARALQGGARPRRHVCYEVLGDHGPHFGTRGQRDILRRVWRKAKPWTAENVPIAAEAIRLSEGTDIDATFPDDPR